MGDKPVIAYVLLLCALPGAMPLDPASARAGDRTDGTVIAYVSSSTDNQTIRLINPDGTDDRVIWRIPNASHPDDGLGALSWQPDGSELLFDSSHE